MDAESAKPPAEIELSFGSIKASGSSKPEQDWQQPAVMLKVNAVI
jgi:hypothetical protein